MKKRLLSALLALCMMLTMVPMAFATEGDSSGNSDVSAQVATNLPAADANGVITLQQDVTVSTLQPNMTYDLNGHTLDYSGTSSIVVNENETLTFKDSSVLGSARGGTLKLSGVSLYNSAINPQKDATVNASNITIDCNGSAFYPQGNAAAVNITNCDVTAAVYCVATNAGSEDNYGVAITLTNSTFATKEGSTDNCPVMINVPGTLIMDSCRVTGDRQAVLVRAGNAKITDCTITLTGQYVDDNGYESTKPWGSGNEVPMAAVVVGSQTSAYKADAVCTIEDTTVSAPSDAESPKPAIYVSSNKEDQSEEYAARLTITGSSTDINGNVVVADGKTNAAAAVIIENDAVVNGDITNNSSVSAVAVLNGASLRGSVTAEATGSDSVYVEGSTDAGNQNVVAMNMTTAKPYNSLEDAISAAQDGDTIELLKDIDNVIGGEGNTKGKFKIEKDLTLNGNGHTIKAANGFVAQTSMFNIENKADVAITNLRIDSNNLAKHGLNIYYAGEVTLNNVEIINGTATAITNNGSEVTATGLTTSDNAWGAVNVDHGGTFNLVSGTLNEPSQIWSEDADDNEGSEITVPGGWTEVKVNKLDDTVEDVKTHYTTDIKKLGEAYNEDTETVYDTVGRALSAAQNGETVQVINTSEVTGATVKEGVTLQVNSGVTLSGSLTNSGTIVNSGTITASITNNGNGEMTSEIRFSVSPGDAEVTVYDSTGDKVAGSGNTYRLANGNYRYTVSADGYYSESDNFTVDDEADTISVTLEERSSSSSGGSSSSSSNRYTVSVDDDIDNGSIRVSPSRAERGDTVTITIDPDEGYELDSLTVRDSSGDRISVERQSDTRYTFEMPSGRVTVDATFTEVAETPETPDQIGSFTDVDTDDWFADAVQYMLDNGMMNGVTDTTFGPGTTTTRGMIVTILYRLEGEPDTTASSFTDAASGMYYADAVAWAQANSIVTGITETIFAPDQAITREQMAAILYRYAQYKGYDVTASNDLSSYTDASRISAYATTAMQWANAEGLITGNTSTTINPTGNATRAEVATILMRFCETVTK